MTKHAKPDHPVLDVLTKRWSPYVYSDRAVSEDDLRSLFEAVRWAASSYNEQPWRYVVATQADPAAFERLLSCLNEPNQAWARRASVLALGIVSTRFARNGKPNPAAVHDLGLGAGNLLAEATARGIDVHQMIGIFPDRARELYALPEDSEAVTALAIGYAGEPDSADSGHGDRDRAPRTRKPLAEFVFGEAFGAPAGWL